MAVPLQQRIIDGRGFVTQPWAMFFQAEQHPPMLAGSHSERINSYPAEKQAEGASFIELDRGAVYMRVDLASALMTSVDADSAAGGTTLNVFLTQGFRIGQTVYIGQGTAREEIGVIAAITPGVSFTLVAVLANDHTAVQGDRVTSSPRTSVDVDSASGAPTLNVVSTMGFTVGSRVLIAPNTPRQERAVVAAIPLPPPIRLTLETNLVFTHTAAQADRVGYSAEWVYVYGMCENTLANFPIDLGELDAGFLFRATNYDRIWRWTGSAWERSPGELPTLFVGLFCTAPGTGWKLLDGTGNPFTYTTATGGTATITIQDARGYYPKMAAAFTGNQVAATAPGFTGGVTAGGSTGLTINSGQASIGTPSSLVAVQSGVGTTVAALDHTHVDAGHVHGTTEAGHTHAAGTLALDALGQPAHMDFLPFVKL